MSFKNKVKVISFYTVGTPYEEEVVHLKNSCAYLGIPIEAKPLSSQGSWEKNVALKPQFIWEELQSCQCPLVWVDADAVFLKKPDFSLFAKADFSVRFMEIFKDNPQYAINSATIFMNQTKEAHELVYNWVKRCEELCAQASPPPFVDQISLYEVLLENKRAKVVPLPISYCKIFDTDSFFIDDDQVVIEQRQASRRYKTLV